MKKFISGLLTAVLLATTLAGCGGTADSSSQGEGSTAAADSSNITGTVTMNGSTSMEKFANALDEAFMAKYPGIQATVQFTGSGAGIEAVANGTVDIGNSSRALKDEEKAKGLVENVVAIDGIAVVVDKANPVGDIAKDQLAQVYSGQITNWKDLGGSDQQIVVIGREASSGTRGAFEELLKLEDKCKYAQEIDSTGAVMAKVAATPGAIGYVSLDVIDDTVHTLKIDGVEPTEENIKAGSYTLQRPFVMATKGEVSEQSQAVQELFNYINSDEGQQIISKVGLISAK